MGPAERKFGDHPRRLIAYAYTVAHCAYVRNDLLSRTGELLDIDLIIIETAMDYLVENNRLILRADFKGRDLIYLPKLYFAEIELAKKIQALEKGRHPCPDIDIKKALFSLGKKCFDN